MKILVTGVKGQLGFDVVKELTSRGHEVAGVDIEEMDITDKSSVKAAFSKFRPQAVVHCAAWTAVDAAEERENRQKVRAVNATGTENIAKLCAEYGAKMVYISTDYVFGGDGVEPWTCESTPSPINYYGQTKYEGELAVRENLKEFFIIRTAWVFGLNGKNFVKTMLNAAKTREEVRVVGDQIGTPTYTPDLARLIADMIVTQKYGVYHVTNEGGYISWYDFTREIYALAGIKTRVVKVTTEEYGLSKAKRPFNSRLDRSGIVANGFEPLPDWRDALKRYLKSLGG